MEKSKPVNIYYWYHKEQPITGSLFYAIEYTLFLNNFSIPSTFYFLIPLTIKKPNLEKLLRTKYSTQYIEKILNSTKILYLSEYFKIFPKINKEQHLYICQDTLWDLRELIPIGKKYLICNREFQSLSKQKQQFFIKCQKSETFSFWYETLPQKIPNQNSLQNIRYSLKLGTQFFIEPNKIIRTKENKIVGEPQKGIINQRALTFEDISINYYPKEFIYYQREFEENNRSVIEAYFYNIPFTIKKNPQNRKDSMPERLQNPQNFHLYQDELINTIKDNYDKESMFYFNK